MENVFGYSFINTLELCPLDEVKEST